MNHLLQIIIVIDCIVDKCRCPLKSKLKNTIISVSIHINILFEINVTCIFRHLMKLVALFNFEIQVNVQSSSELDHVYC